MVAAVIDTVARRDRYAEVLADCEVRVAGLTADDDTVRGRLRRRDTGPTLQRHLDAWHEDRGGSVADFTIGNDRAVADVATEMLVRAGWLTGPVTRTG